ncbi:hypothetical protein HOY82DRAFT_616617 [Tuber indicum]|nr:hypothetical protein HOY82DRAFT_616617 [Tuber indicum]
MDSPDPSTPTKDRKMDEVCTRTFAIAGSLAPRNAVDKKKFDVTQNFTEMQTETHFWEQVLSLRMEAADNNWGSSERPSQA